VTDKTQLIHQGTNWITQKRHYK